MGTSPSHAGVGSSFLADVATSTSLSALGIGTSASLGGVVSVPSLSGVASSPPLTGVASSPSVSGVANSPPLSGVVSSPSHAGLSSIVGVVSFATHSAVNVGFSPHSLILVSLGSSKSSSTSDLGTYLSHSSIRVVHTQPDHEVK